MKKNDLFKTLFDVMPTAVFLADHDARVITVNLAGQKFFHISDSEAKMQLCGHAFHCVNSIDPGDCGHTDFCKDCLLRKTIRFTAEGQDTFREKGVFHTRENGEIVVHHILVTATRLEYHGHPLALIIVEDIANITQLQGLLPICCSCHRIRDRHGHWTRLEDFIEKHSEADFTHDLCPICSDQMRQKVGLK